MNPTEQNSSASQENTTAEILEVLDGFGTNVEQLVKGLENNNQFKVETSLMLLVKQDLGKHLFLAEARLHDPVCRVRLIDPLKAIEADLIRAKKFTGKTASRVLPIFVPSQLETVRTILASLQGKAVAHPRK